MKDNLVKVKEAIIVEGRYDKNTLSQYISANIIETGGFQIFTRKDILSLIKKLAEASGVIILTDSDSAGFLIRNHLKGSISAGTVKHAYIPDIHGKEKRKRTASGENKLGVEAMSRDVILNALKAAGATMEGIDRENSVKNKKRLTKASLYELGLSGRAESAVLRRMLLKKLELPERLGTSAMLDTLNALYPYDELTALIRSHILDTAGCDHTD